MKAEQLMAMALRVVALVIAACAFVDLVNAIGFLLTGLRVTGHVEQTDDRGCPARVAGATAGMVGVPEKRSDDRSWGGGH